MRSRSIANTDTVLSFAISIYCHSPPVGQTMGFHSTHAGRTWSSNILSSGRDLAADSFAPRLGAGFRPEDLETLRDYILHQFPETRIAGEMHWTRRWWRFRRVLGPSLEVLGVITERLRSIRPSRNFPAARIPGYSGYGLTETAPIVTLNIISHAAGHCGQGSRRRRDTPRDDGEVMVRGAMFRWILRQEAGESLNESLKTTGLRPGHRRNDPEGR